VEKWEDECSMCHKRVFWSEIEYSQGEKVCPDCKKITLPADKRAFDNYVTRAR
jgi:NAD-dependent SIR2 family protein deacetylase